MTGEFEYVRVEEPRLGEYGWQKARAVEAE